MRTLRPLLIPLVAPWCVCLAALGAVLTAFPGDAVQTFGEPQPGGLTVSLTAARPGSPPGRELTAMYADPPPAGVRPPRPGRWRGSSVGRRRSDPGA